MSTKPRSRHSHLVPGHDTTTVAIAALAYEFARHPEWQERVRKDCERAIQASKTETLSQEAAAGLDRLDWCANEVLRLYSPVRYVQRRVVSEFEFEGHRIPKNSSILLSMHHTHHDSTYFESPEQFCPDRFAPSPSGRSIDPDAWAPFGKGPHVCLGMGFSLLEIKAFFCSMLPKVRLELPHDYSLKVEGLPVSMPNSSIPIRLMRID
jgi:cytochrome P450